MKIWFLPYSAGMQPHCPAWLVSPAGAGGERQR